MAKRRNKQKRGSSKRTKTAVAQTAASVAGAGETEEQKLKQTATEVQATATPDDNKIAAKAPDPEPGMSAKAMDDLARTTLKTVQAIERRLTADKEEVRKKGAALDEKEAELDEKVEKLTSRDEQIREREIEFQKRHEDVIQREFDADAGFSQRHRDALAQLEAEGQAVRDELSNHRKQIRDERAEFEQEIRIERAKLDQELRDGQQEARVAEDAERKTRTAKLEDERAQLQEAQDEVQAQAKTLRQGENNLKLDRELLDEDRSAVEEKVEQRAAREIELREGEISALNERLTAARENHHRISLQLDEREEADRRFGEETPEQVLERLTALEKERDNLKSALGQRPSAEAAQRLEELEREKELLESDRLQLLADLAHARSDAARKRIAVTELESLRDEKRSLESANALLSEAGKQLRAEVDTVVKAAEGKSPFPSCSEMDENEEYQSPLPTTDSIPKLDDFADQIRHRMASSEEDRYYSAEDVRSFLGGLAMSRLHLLQGISGTGKTSLPMAFARAIGAEFALIEVQAGWRDRQDLIGHFNNFERRFYESEFLQALYRAGCPRNRERPFIIVLDEMNLSHPEQYFADLLSAIELPPRQQKLVLMTASVEPAPRLLEEGGTKLPIPQNVWFVGTANHDETTKDFADKTYDRSHVMELPTNIERFEPEKHQHPDPVSLAAMEDAFELAKEKYQSDARKAYDFLQATDLKKMLGDRFRVGWGNRLEKQMRSYVPVVVAAGGSVGEATDYILSTKLLRKIQDRHDNRPENITALRELVQTKWPQLDKEAQADRSLAILSEELHRLGHDDD